MAKITISRIYELSKYLGTQAGKELQDPLTYMSEFAELTLRNLRNGLTFNDNLDCVTKRVTVKNNTETIVSIASKKRAVRINIDRAIDDTFYVVTGFGWKFNTDGDVVIKVTFAGSPGTADIPIDIIIHFG